jgi:hypothetical protein
MLQQILSAIHPESLGYLIAIIGFGAYHGLNPGMGWLFALSLGLQQHSGRVVWISLFPIAIGHAASVGLVALIVLAGAQFISTSTFQLVTAIMLLVFGVYKLFNYYRHPRWVGMKVGIRDLFTWSFLMATAHGAGLMIAPALVGMAGGHAAHSAHIQPGLGLLMSVGVHTLAMLVVMGTIAWIIYKKLSLSVLRQKWINFDLIWAVALIVVGLIALMSAF